VSSQEIGVDTPHFSSCPPSGETNTEKMYHIVMVMLLRTIVLKVTVFATEQNVDERYDDVL
jgi:hypothetical protein